MPVLFQCFSINIKTPQGLGEGTKKSNNIAIAGKETVPLSGFKDSSFHFVPFRMTRI